MSVSWYSSQELIDLIPKKIVQVNSVLDVGPGIHPQSYINPAVHILVEPYLPYIQYIQSKENNYTQFVYLNTTWDKVLPYFPDKSLDTIFAIDVIEHFTKEDGRKFIIEAERIARKQIAIFTPLGWYPQTYEEDAADRWGMGGGHWQAHHSGWEPSDFSDGWDHYCCREYHFVDQYDQPLEKPFGAFWAIRTFAKSASEFNPLDRLSMYSSFKILTYLSKRVLRKIKRKFVK